MFLNVFALIFAETIFISTTCVAYSLRSVSAGNEVADISAGAHPEAWWQRGDRVLVLPPAALEAGRRSHQPASVHLGGK